MSILIIPNCSRCPKMFEPRLIQTLHVYINIEERATMNDFFHMIVHFVEEDTQI